MHPRFFDALSRCTGNPRDQLAYAAGIAAINTEVLPAILGGEWQRAKRGWLELQSKKYQRSAACGVLLDHDFLVKRAGSRGPLTWKRSVLISQPYNVAREDGSIMRSAWVAGMELAAKGFGAWVLPGGAPWFPVQTSLVLISPLLAGLNAQEHGFIALTP